MTPYSRSVHYYETDMMGVVHHANYIHWMEEARIGPSSARSSTCSIVSPVKSVACEYKSPCTFGDRITVEVSVDSFNGVVLAIRYRMRKEDGTLVCEARSEHVFLTREGRFVRMKQEMPEFCEAIAKEAEKNE